MLEFFNRDKKEGTDPFNNQSIIVFINQNAQDEVNDLDSDTTKSMGIQKKFKPKSGWRPNPPNRALEIFQRSIKQEILKSKPKTNRNNNLTKQERIGLQSLKDLKISEDITPKISDKIAEQLNKMRSLNLISEKNYDYLNINNPTEARFYLLPKLAKKDIPRRPICSSINHLTSHISKFVDEHIKEHVPKTKTYVRDTQYFISRLKQLCKIPEGILLVTLDVSSLYTNIPNHEGILAVADHIRRDPEKQKKIGPHLLKLLELVLHSMSFSFNEDHYLQIGGTAMGTAAASYANLFMDRFKPKALDNWPLKPLLWLRFIDDIFMIWTHGVDQLKEFIEYLNGIHPTIKFTYNTVTIKSAS